MPHLRQSASRYHHPHRKPKHFTNTTQQIKIISLIIRQLKFIWHKIANKVLTICKHSVCLPNQNEKT
jgi:hypothetical protein